MKKSTFLLAFAFLLVFNLQAQEKIETTSKSGYGFKAGYSMLSSRATNRDRSASETASGFYVGLFADFNLSNKFNFLVDLTYARYSKDGSSSDVLIYPILLKYKANDGVGLSAGLQLDYLLNEENGQGLKRLGFGIPAGLSLNISENVMFDLRYVFGISNRLDKNSFFGTDTKVVLNYFQAGLAYKF